jgi:integrase
MRVLEPIWLRTPETATHVRQRIEAILDWATVREYRQGANPARWRGHLDKLLPSRAKVAPVVHHRSLPYDQVSAFLTTLRQREAVAARALEFIILTAARAGEVLGMTWGEVDFATKIWTIPASRMKAQKEHRVPLSPTAVALLEKQPREGDYVFPGGQRPRLSPMAIKMLLTRMGRRDFVTHGFRSSFRDWAAERTNYPSEVAEMALAHRVGSAVELAYRRTDMFERRRRLMADWATFCETPTTNAEVMPAGASADDACGPHPNTGGSQNRAGSNPSKFPVSSNPAGKAAGRVAKPTGQPYRGQSRISFGAGRGSSPSLG